MGSVGLCVCVFLLPDQRLYKGDAPSKSEDHQVKSLDPNSHRRVLINISANKGKFVRDLSPIMLA